MLNFKYGVLCALSILFVGVVGDMQAATLNLVPMPKQVVRAKDASAYFEITSQTVVAFDREFEDSAMLLHDMFARAGQFDMKMTNELKADSKNVVRFHKGKSDAKTTEGYTLKVTPNDISITASGPAGAFYAVQTLRQLLPDYIEDTTAPLTPRWRVPSVTIVDDPALPWRGLMLDCSRQFHTMDSIKKMLDAMAFLKQNRFHWHLIDDNGWRLQIDKYPQLTEIGSVRGPASAIHKGFYTKDDVREIVAYAKARYIEVIPEFEMPAHSNACLNVLPELSCKGTPYKRATADEEPMDWNSWNWYNKHESGRHFCAGNDDVFAFHNDIFDEALELFPFGVWHVGGDERPHGIWDKCPKCQARMKEFGLKDEHALQQWFMQKISAMLAAKGKTAISWGVTRSDDYYKPTDIDDLGNGAILLNWHGSTKLACQLGMHVVNAASPWMYIDYPPFKMYAGWKRPDWMSFLPLERAYEFNPIPDGLTPEQEKFVIGAQTCIWCDVLAPEQLFSWVFPRVLAAAETAWLAKRDRGTYENFHTRVYNLEPRFAMFGIPFAHPVVGGNKGDGHYGQ